MAGTKVPKSSKYLPGHVFPCLIQWALTKEKGSGRRNGKEPGSTRHVYLIQFLLSIICAPTYIYQHQAKEYFLVNQIIK